MENEKGEKLTPLKKVDDMNKHDEFSIFFFTKHQDGFFSHFSLMTI